MFRLFPSYEKYPCQDTRNEYHDSAFQENRRVNASIGMFIYVYTCSYIQYLSYAHRDDTRTRQPRLDDRDHDQANR